MEPEAADLTAIASPTAAPAAPDIGRLERVALREVWAHEALDSTKWLQDNLDVLNDVTGLSLESAEREQAASAFNDIATWDYAAVGRVVGASGIRVDTRSDLMAALARARSEPDRAWIISMEVGPHDYPRPLGELGKGLAALMHEAGGR